MTAIDIHMIKKNVAKYLDHVAEGESFVILQNGKPIAELKALKPNKKAKKRPFGLCAGEFEVPEDFDAPLPEEIFKDFEGK